MKTAWFFFIFGVLLLAIAEVAKVYFIMPFPGSQLQNNVELAYNINRYIWVFRLGFGALIFYGLIRIFKRRGIWPKLLASGLLLLLAGIFYVTNFVMLADKIFYQPNHVVFAPVTDSGIGNQRLIVGIEQNGEAKAYPINIIGYHHQVRDSLANEPVMITYCTVCRTARVFRPLVDGKMENFRLVGMDQFNAMFEDATTHSWWRQANGECCAGPLKGKKLPEVPAQQMTLEAWKLLYPQSKVLLPDPAFADQYASLEGYDNGTRKSTLTGTDTISGNPKSWVIVVVTDQGEKMYDWSTLKKQNVINDSVGHEPVLLTIEGDMLSFHALSRQINDSVLRFTFDSKRNGLTDDATLSFWNMNGVCVDGSMKGSKLKYLKAYQEFRHSYTTFHTVHVEQPYP
jgi:uncharacterized protein DUF3179